MIEESVTVERLDGSPNSVRITLNETDDVQVLQRDLQLILDSCFNQGLYNIVLNLENLEYPPTSFIALIIEATSRARRLQGDVWLVNVSHSAKNNFVTFTPTSYLTLDNNDGGHFTKRPPETETEADVADSDTNPIPPEEAVEDLSLDDEDIAEVPLVEKLDESILEVEDTSSTEVNHLRVRSESTNLYTICDFVTEHAEKAGMGERDVGKTKIAIYEACLNIIEHAYRSNPEHWIDVWVEYDPERFTIYVKDYGIGFEFHQQKRYDVQAAMEGRQTGGFGLYIIRRSMDEVEYRADPINGNRLTLVKYLRSGVS